MRSCSLRCNANLRPPVQKAFLRGSVGMRVEHASGAEQLGIRTMPAFFVNGTLTDVSFGMRHLEEAIERALLAAR